MRRIEVRIYVGILTPKESPKVGPNKSGGKLRKTYTDN